VGGACAIQAVCVTSPDGQIWPSAIFLDVQSCLLPHEAMRVGLWWLDCHRQSFVSPLLFSLVTDKVHFYPFCFLISVLILLIFYFVIFL